MSLYAQFATDKEKEIEGVEVMYASNDDGTVPTFVIARLGSQNKAYQKANEKALKPYRNQIKIGAMEDGLLEDILLKLFVDHILKGWRNIKDRTGKELAFTRENAIRLLKDLPDLYEDLVRKSTEASMFREEEMEEDLKNS